jgi:hypothetical protein
MKDAELWRRWAEAGKRMAIDSSAAVPCPVCGQANLVATDIPIEGSEKFERILSCPRCRARNVLLMTKQGD